FLFQLRTHRARQRVVRAARANVRHALAAAAAKAAAAANITITIIMAITITVVELALGLEWMSILAGSVIARVKPIRSQRVVATNRLRTPKKNTPRNTKSTNR